AQPYDMLLGRKTYDMFAEHQNESMNDGHVYVVSSSRDDPKWQNATLLSGDAVTEVRELKQQDGPLLQIHGSWQLIQSLVKADLIDEYRIWTFPVVTGPGKRLFGENAAVRNLQLVKSEPTGNGVVMSIYRKSASAHS
ncbi:MAG: dihydrofolate reductase family protein, partial [Pseudomonadota bacterium]